MTIKTNYERRKERLLNDSTICNENKALYKHFLERKEHKLKRKNGLRELDDGCYRTLYQYLVRISSINAWFHNKPLAELNKKDIERVYNDLEDGNITNNRGEPLKDRQSFYSKCFKSDLFELAGKAELAREVLDQGTHKNQTPVRFIREDTLRQLVSVTNKPDYKALLWLGFDIGENISALLQLRKKDFTRQTDEHTKAPEYRVNLRKETLKRTRTPRSELTNYEETVRYLDIILADLKDDEQAFPFGYGAAVKYLKRAVRITKARCIPGNEPVTWKDLRSSMACDLLTKGWSRDEINRRLGHRPSSAEIDKYINFLAIDGKKPQRKVYEHNLAKIQAELEESQQKEKLYQTRLQHVQEQLSSMEQAKEQEFERMRKQLLRETQQRIQQLLKESITDLRAARAIQKAR